MSKPLLPAYDKLSEALLGLTTLALDRPRAEHPRLVEQFRAQYPEIVLVEDGKAILTKGFVEGLAEGLRRKP